MPEVYLKVKKHLHPFSQPCTTAQQLIVRNLANDLRKLVVVAWGAMHEWGTITESGVLPDFLPCPEIEIDGVTPDIEIIVSPNWTQERYASWPRFRHILTMAVDDWFIRVEKLNVIGRQSAFSVDIKVNFIMGGGLSLKPGQEVTATWPDEDLSGVNHDLGYKLLTEHEPKM